MKSSCEPWPNGTFTVQLALQEQDYAETFKWYKAAAWQGDAEAAWRLGYFYEHGQGVEADLFEAAEWYRLSAKQGNETGAQMLSAAEALLPSQSYAQILKAAQKGIAAAERAAGLAYDFGNGTEQDYAEAFKWYKAAAWQGDAEAEWRLGYFYRYGQGVEKDVAKAVEWFERSVRNGCGYAKELLAEAESALAEETEQLLIKASAGDGEAQYKLGRRYSYGKGAVKNLDAAFRWFKASAEQGNASGQNALGYCYDMGEGVQEDKGKSSCRE